MVRNCKSGRHPVLSEKALSSCSDRRKCRLLTTASLVSRQTLLVYISWNAAMTWRSVFARSAASWGKGPSVNIAADADVADALPRKIRISRHISVKHLRP